MRFLVMLCVVLLVIAMPVGRSLWAQEGEEPPTTDELLARVDTARADRNSWQSFRVNSYTSFSYTDIFTSESSQISRQQQINTTAEIAFNGNPFVSQDYARNDLMTVEYKQIEQLSAGAQQVETSYTLLAETILVDGRLFVRALRYADSEGLPTMPEGWQEVTDDPEQYFALDSIHLSSLLPAAPPRQTVDPLVDYDFVELVQSSDIREIYNDIQFIQQMTIGEGPNAGRQVDEIRLILNPQQVFLKAFAANDNAFALAEAFVNEQIEMSVTLWLDSTTSQQVRQRFIFVIQGQPNPILFGYSEGDLGETAGVSIIYNFEAEMDYHAINQPVSIVAP